MIDNIWKQLKLSETVVNGYKQLKTVEKSYKWQKNQVENRFFKKSLQQLKTAENCLKSQLKLVANGWKQL